MRYLLGLFSLLLLSFTATAQVDGGFNNSVGIQGFRILQLPKILNQSIKDRYVNTSLNGVMLKFNDNQISYRISGSYFEKDVDFKGMDQTKGKITDYSVKIGFEKNFNYAIIQPYFLTDLGYRSSGFQGTVNQSTNANISKNGLVIAPGFGVKFNVVRQITLYAEGNVEFFYYQGKDDTNSGSEESRSIDKYYKSQFLLNPVSAGIQFHFGSNN